MESENLVTDNPAVKTTLQSIFDEQPEPKLPKQKHYLRWFLYDGVDFEIECQHEEFTGPYICDGESALDDKALFPELFNGDRTPLRDGPIKFWWKVSGEDSELYWDYESDAPEQDPSEQS